jgi:hypothetical protein
VACRLTASSAPSMSSSLGRRRNVLPYRSFFGSLPKIFSRTFPRSSLACTGHGRLARATRRAPSIQAELQTLADQAYADARAVATSQTDLPLVTFPEASPWPLAQVVDAHFWPEVEG